MAVVDYFLKVDGLPGESLDAQHKGQFEIKDFSFGVENPSTIGSATGGAGAGKIKFNEFTIKKTTDQASPIFFKNCVAGAHYKTVVLTARKAGGDATNASSDFLKVTFTDVLTSSYREAGRRAPGSVVVNPPPVDTVGGPIGGLGTTDSGPGDETPQDSISFNYAKLQESVGATRIGVPPISSAMLSFDAATNTFQVSDAPGGVFTVGSQGGLVSRAAMEFNNIAILIGLLTAPFSTAKLSLGILEVREAAINPDAVNAASVNTSSNTGPQPHLFDVILYTPADGALTVEDLTRHGTRIGTLRVDPNAPPTSLDIDLTNLVRRRHLDSFGMRIQLRGAPTPGLNEDKEDEKDDPDVGHENDDQAHADGEHDDDKSRTPRPDFSASFTANLVLDTA